MTQGFAAFRSGLMAWPELDYGFWLDLSRARLPQMDAALEQRLRAALQASKELEAGALANPDEQRQNELVFIGRNLDAAKLKSDFLACMY